MSDLTTTCPRCGTTTRRPLSALLAVQVIGGDAAGSIAYICTACDDLVAAGVAPGAIAILRAAGYAIPDVHSREPYPEERPGGPVFTLDDIVELYAELARDDWNVALIGERP